MNQELITFCFDLAYEIEHLDRICNHNEDFGDSVRDFLEDNKDAYNDFKVYLKSLQGSMYGSTVKGGININGD